MRNKKTVYKIFVTIISCFLLLVANAQPSRKIISFDTDWKFIREEVKGAEQTDFNDATWRSLNVPHDWSIEGPYDRNNPTGRGGGYLPGGIGWYRKTFTVNETDAKQLAFIEFDGVMANSDVWINGFHLGKRPNGYASFEYELTGHLNFGGKKNVIAVRADNTIQPASRYYTGAGIYRHVRMSVTNPVHVAHWENFVSASNVSAAKATVTVQAKIINQSALKQNILVQINIVAPDGKVVGKAEAKQKSDGNTTQIVIQNITVDKPVLWECGAYAIVYRSYKNQY